MFSVIRWIISSIPAIIATIQSIEAITDPNVSGGEKKTLVMRAIKRLYRQLTGQVFPRIWQPLLSTVIDMIVQILNVTGVFPSSSTMSASDMAIAVEAPVKADVVAAAVAKAHEEDPELKEFMEATATAVAE